MRRAAQLAATGRSGKFESRQVDRWADVRVRSEEVGATTSHWLRDYKLA